ncbi:MAG: response regulator [Hydrogenophaga sp.]|nr:response regulator [Hydrogenophaga sp.]
MNDPSRPTSTEDDYCGTFYAARLLGLSVGTVQSLVEKNELSAWKTQGGHRRISMQSVLAYQKRHSIRTPSEESVATGRLKLLVVDDDPAMLAVVQAYLDKWQLPVDSTLMTSAMEALIDMSSLKPDVLVTDLVMPGVDGFELLKTLRGNAQFTDMVVVALTGLGATEIERRGGLPPKTVLAHKPIDQNWLHGFLSAQVAMRPLAAA